MPYPSRRIVWAGVLVCLVCLPWEIFGQAEIEGLYKFIKDQPSGMSAAKGAEILLSVAPQGAMSVTATKPGEVMIAEGTYQSSRSGSRFFPTFLGKAVQA